MSAALNFIGALTIGLGVFVLIIFLISKLLNWVSDFLEGTFQLKAMSAAVLALVITFVGIGVTCLIAGKMVSV